MIPDSQLIPDTTTGTSVTDDTTTDTHAVRLELPLRFTGSRQNILYSLNNYLTPSPDNPHTVSPYWLKRAKDDLQRRARLQLKGVTPVKDRVDIELRIHRGTNRQMDMGNFSPIEKFVTDTVVRYGVLMEDNWKFVRSVKFIDAGLNKGNEHCEYLIKIVP